MTFSGRSKPVRSVHTTSRAPYSTASATPSLVAAFSKASGDSPEDGPTARAGASDGGLTWSAPRTNNTGVIGGQPVVHPNGTVIVPIDNASATAVGAFFSTNGGASWSAVTTITRIKHHTAAGSLHESPLPSAEIDSAGTVYVAWADCRFRRGCKANDIVFARS